ncbi:hypothetical protein C8F04DRAFT_173599 [Mycena alexandri]|uniref:Uncharacterized protein n=1 Tax=Mycena alexandri TaxID=1745969 RepID=A0AAD6T7H6_9AGAR|nr:hypothetical protein C8F04DRAFT_173599 [Mycena alexandri]
MYMSSQLSSKLGCTDHPHLRAALRADNKGLAKLIASIFNADAETVVLTFMTRPAFLWPLCLIYFFTASTLATRTLSERSEQSQAQCTDDFNARRQIRPVFPRCRSRHSDQRFIFPAGVSTSSPANSSYRAGRSSYVRRSVWRHFSRHPRRRAFYSGTYAAFPPWLGFASYSFWSTSHQ